MSFSKPQLLTAFCDFLAFLNPTGRRGRARKASHRSVRSSQDSDEEHGGEEEEAPRTQKRGKAKPRLTFSSDEDEEVGGKRLAAPDPDDPQVQPAGRGT